MQKLKKTWWVVVAVVGLVVAYEGQVLHAIHGQSLTWDEGDHIFAGYESWKTHDFGLNPEHPPMVKLVATLPLLGLPLKVPALQGRMFKTEAYMDGKELLFHNGPADGGRYDSRTLVWRVRLAAAVFGVVAALLVFAAGTEMFGVEVGLVALLLFCFEPTLVAHGAYVTTDMAASCTIFGTVYAFWRWVQQRSVGRLVVVGLAGGLALAAKHSTVLLLPMLVLLAVYVVGERWWGSWGLKPRVVGGQNVRAEARTYPKNEARTYPKSEARSRGSEARWGGSEARWGGSESRWGASVGMDAVRMVGVLAVVIGIAVVVLWAFYGFRYAARPAGLALSPSLAGYVAPLAPGEAEGILFAGRHHLLPESWLYGLADVRAMANGMTSYFMGNNYEHGVWFYFPVLFTIKSTLGMMGLLLLTVFAMVRGVLRGRRAWVFLILPPVVYFLVAMDSHLNIGARHILPVWVFCCVIAAAGAVAWMRRGRVWVWVVGLLLAMHVGTTLRAEPNYMAYANEAWGGPTQTYKYLSDSNTDWAQQLVATADYLKKRGVKQCWIAYFAAPFILPQDYGIPCRMLPTPDTGFEGVQEEVPPVIDGPVLISAGDLNSFESGSRVLNAYEGFRGLKPTAFIQDGVFVFDGQFAVPLASSLSHVQRSQVALRKGDVAGALSEAEVAEKIAPGFVQTEMALGDAEVAAGKMVEARAAYQRAGEKIETMEPGERETWRQTLAQKIAKAQ